jgi:AcrR family transcriptional regulator
MPPAVRRPAKPSRPKRPRTVPRKTPKQERAHATVTAILDATERLLTTQGYDRTSTNRVALAAGVSVGSLYQYFPSKEALVAALAERHTAEMSRVTREKLAEVLDAPLEVASCELVRAMVDAHLVDPKLHKVLMEQVPRVGRLDRLESYEREMCMVVRAALERRRDDIGPTNLDVAAFVLTHAVEGVIHRAVLEAHDGALDRDAFVAETSQLIIRYLAKA